MPETIHCVLVFICLMQLVACDFSCPSKCECTEGTDGLKVCKQRPKAASSLNYIFVILVFRHNARAKYTI